MSTKTFIFIGMTIGSVIGGYLPVLLGDKSILSFTAVLTSGIGAAIGVFVGIKVSQWWGN